MGIGKGTLGSYSLLSGITNTTIFFNAGPNLLIICCGCKKLRRNTIRVVRENRNAIGIRMS